ncbi:MAG: hypothetical protein ACRC01_01470 [Deefgea sp.]
MSNLILILDSLRLAEKIVLILTPSTHGDAVYAANAYIMDYLKTEALFWGMKVTATARISVLRVNSTKQHDNVGNDVMIVDAVRLTRAGKSNDR